MDIKQRARWISVCSYQDYTGQPSTQPEVDMRPNGSVWRTIPESHWSRQATCPGFWIFPLPISWDADTATESTQHWRWRVSDLVERIWVRPLALTQPPMWTANAGKKVCLVWVTVIWGLCYSSLTWSLRAIHIPGMLYIFFCADVIFLCFLINFSLK